MNITSYKKKGKTYYKFQIRIGSKVTRRQGFETKNEAIKAYTMLLNEPRLIAKSKTKFNNVYESFLKLYETTVTGSTIDKFKSTYEIHIKPVLGDMYVEDIDEIIGQEFILSLRQFISGKLIFNRAKKILDHAIFLKYISYNPFNYVTIPKFKASEDVINFLEKEQVIKLLDEVSNDVEWYIIFRILIYSGMRRGELLSLHWDDIDFKKNKISINKTLTVDSLGFRTVTSPKTKSSNRVIDMDIESMNSLKKWKLQNNINIKGIVFPNSKNEYRRVSDIQDKLNKISKKLGLGKVRVHDLRHTHASLLFESGANIKEVQERLGHGSERTTMNIYVHVTKSKKIQTINNFTDFLAM